MSIRKKEFTAGFGAPVVFLTFSIWWLRIDYRGTAGGMKLQPMVATAAGWASGDVYEFHHEFCRDSRAAVVTRAVAYAAFSYSQCI